MLKKIIGFALILVLASIVMAQDDPPVAAPKSASKTGNEKAKSFSWGSVTDLPISPPFVSTEGRFSIGLKQQIDGYSPITPKQLGIEANGSQLTWKLDEGEIRVLFLEFGKGTMTGSEKELQTLTKNGKENIFFTYPTAKVRDESYFHLNVLFPASKITFDLSDNMVIVQRIYLVQNRMYKMLAIFQKPENEKFISEVFDSFKIISQEDINADIRRKFDSIKPSPLPQEPVVKKLKSDAEDEGLKGKVKQIVLESEDLSGTWSVQGRKLASETNFNKNGNRVDSIFYSSKLVPSGATVWGYIDGKRVFKTETIRDETGPPPMAMPKAKIDENLPKPDPRYQYSYEYKYVDGRLSEMQLISNIGRIVSRTVYNYSKNQVERLVFTPEGNLNQKYLVTLDEKGNGIEEINFGLANFKYYGDRKYRYSYEFDKQGNWIKKTTTMEVLENGVTLFKPYSVYYRTITYW